MDVVVDLVYFTLGHLRRPGQVQVPKGTSETRSAEAPCEQQQHATDSQQLRMLHRQSSIPVLNPEQKQG